MKHFLVALQFLTILPIQIKEKIKDEDFGRSLGWFPFVGMVIGLVLVLVYNFFSFLPTMVTAALALITVIALSNGLHLDGFADTCDGIYGFTSRERALEIMRDSHKGTMGVAAVALLLILKFALLASMPLQSLWKLLLLMLVFSRWAQVLCCYIADYARQDGKGKNFVVYANKPEFFKALLFTLALFTLLLQFNGVVLFVISFLPVLLLINYIKRKLGGMTGDTIGAISEISEVLVLFFGIMIIMD